MISSLRTWMFNKSVKEHQNYNLNSGRHGVNTCDTICLLANGTDQHNHEATELYRKRLLSLGKAVDVLYYFDEKQERDDGYSRQAIRWNGIPQHETVNSILEKEYDLMIYLSLSLEDHMRYLATLCNARFKIGPALEAYTYLFDLMIDVEKISDTASLIQQIDNQLKTLSAK